MTEEFATPGGRRREVVRVPDDFGRDAGKLFQITEKPAIVAQKWAMRYFLAAKGVGIQIPESILRLGMPGVALYGINAVLAAPLKWEDMEPLCDELLQCVQVVRNPQRPDIAQPLIVENDFQEPRTIFWVQFEVLRVHTNFSFAAALSKFWTSVREGSAATEETSTTT